jgi:hypothetical protein
MAMSVELTVPNPLARGTHRAASGGPLASARRAGQVLQSGGFGGEAA